MNEEETKRTVRAMMNACERVKRRSNRTDPNMGWVSMLLCNGCLIVYFVTLICMMVQMSEFVLSIDGFFLCNVHVQ